MPRRKRDPLPTPDCRDCGTSCNMDNLCRCCRAIIEDARREAE